MAPPAGALEAGDILFASGASVYVLDPESGLVEPFSVERRLDLGDIGGIAVAAQALTFGADGALLLPDEDGLIRCRDPPSTGFVQCNARSRRVVIYRVDPVSAERTVLSQGGLLDPRGFGGSLIGMAVAHDGRIFASVGFPGRIVGIDPEDGSQSLLLEGVRSPGAIAVVPGRRVDVQVWPTGGMVRLRSVIQMAVFGSEAFDVARVDRGSLALGVAGAPAFLALPFDLDRDGFGDLLLFFRAGRGERELCVSGTAGGAPFQGCAARGGAPGARPQLRRKTRLR